MRVVRPLSARIRARGTQNEGENPFWKIYAHFVLL